MPKIMEILGLAGVHEDENPTAIRWNQYFNMLLIAAIFWLIFNLHLEFKNDLSVDESWFADFIVWCFFLTETCFLTFLVNDKKRYLKQNWLNVAIVVIGLPLLLLELGPVVILLRVLRVILIFGLISPWVVMLIRFLTDSRLDTTIFAALIILVTAGTIISGIDPNINSIEDGIWWAWVTVSTVGYGDVVPSSTAGRIFSGILILVGMGLFSVITANFAAILVQRSQHESKVRTHKKLQQALDALAHAKEREELMIEHLEFIHERMRNVEASLNNTAPAATGMDETNEYKPRNPY